MEVCVENKGSTEIKLEYADCFLKRLCFTELCPSGKGKENCGTCKFFYYSKDAYLGDLNYYCKIHKNNGEEAMNFPCGNKCKDYKPEDKND